MRAADTRRRWFHTILMLAAAACSSRRAANAPPPSAEFLVSSTDSVFWVTTAGGQVRVRGVPIVLARSDDRFYEIYSVDDDFSYDDALLLGQRLYRRDLTTGDSSIVFADTIVARIALAYARTHPDERPLTPNDEVAANPGTSATAEIDILGVLGPFVSYEYHVDVELPGRTLWHTTRRGVIDVRSGGQSTVADVFGADVGRQLTATARHAYEAVRDSILRQRDALRGDERRAADALARLTFDDRSFILDADAGLPTVAFGIPGRGEGAVGNLLELDPLGVDSAKAPGWWGDVWSLLPRPGGDSAADVDRWRADQGRYTVVARYDTSGEIARVSIADSANHEWTIANIAAPIRRIDWLDRPPLSDANRRALMRAFNEAAKYDEKTRVASAPAGPVWRLTRSAALPAIPPAQGHSQSHSRRPKSSLVRSPAQLPPHTIRPR